LFENAFYVVFKGVLAQAFKSYAFQESCGYNAVCVYVVASERQTPAFYLLYCAHEGNIEK
jgi:hypothetical protein